MLFDFLSAIPRFQWLLTVHSGFGRRGWRPAGETPLPLNTTVFPCVYHMPLTQTNSTKHAEDSTLFTSPECFTGSGVTAGTGAGAVAIPS